MVKQAKDEVSAAGSFPVMPEAEGRRELDSGPRRHRSAPRVLKRPDPTCSPSVK
ncbi:hypothetical protein GCM10010129_68940 [Streptomyces fumigatiscleroticus]|nr:hypothetical protein GCM10010129_68940 [Streptomyces fumigatiscleroticus]